MISMGRAERGHCLPGDRDGGGGWEEGDGKMAGRQAGRQGCCSSSLSRPVRAITPTPLSLPSRGFSPPHVYLGGASFLGKWADSSLLFLSKCVYSCGSYLGRAVESQCNEKIRIVLTVWHLGCLRDILHFTSSSLLLFLALYLIDISLVSMTYLI